METNKYHDKYKMSTQLTPEQNEISLSQLSLPQLDRVKTQLEEDTTAITVSMQRLKTVQQRLKESKDSLLSLRPENDDKTILVPLTGSMYVPGKLKDAEKVLVDVGAGYYVEKSTKKGGEFFQRKIDYVTKNLEKLQEALITKRKMREEVVALMQLKVHEAQGRLGL